MVNDSDRIEFLTNSSAANPAVIKAIKDYNKMQKLSDRTHHALAEYKRSKAAEINRSLTIMQVGYSTVGGAVSLSTSGNDDYRKCIPKNHQCTTISSVTNPY